MTDEHRSVRAQIRSFSRLCKLRPCVSRHVHSVIGALNDLTLVQDWALSNRLNLIPQGERVRNHVGVKICCHFP
jgi:hypothetical protein